eukprot:jgi/Picsp_1/1722/NSC_05195-R1_heterogeneous nuclear ribonucleoprotein f
MERRLAVRLKGIPSKATATDILHFLCELDISEDDIELLHKGRAILQCRSVEDVKKALSMDKSHLVTKFGGHCIRIFEMDRKQDSQVEETRKRSSTDMQRISCSDCGGSNIIQIDGLPESTSKEDIQNLFWRVRVVESDIRAFYDDCGIFIVLLRVPNNEIAAIVMQIWHNTVITTSKGSFRLSMHSPPEDNSDAEATMVRNIVKLRGLPARIAEEDIKSFLSGCLIKPGGIYLQNLNENKNNKVAYVELASHNDAQHALKKDHCCLTGQYKDRYCLVDLISRIEMEAARLQYSGNHGPSRGNGVSHRRDSLIPMNTMVAMPWGLWPNNQMLSMPWMPPREMFLPEIWNSGVGGQGQSLPPFQSPTQSNSSQKPQQNSNSARYCVKDLKTGKSIFLDPSFNPASQPRDDERLLRNSNSSRDCHKLIQSDPESSSQTQMGPKRFHSSSSKLLSARGEKEYKDDHSEGTVQILRNRQVSG